MNLLMNCVDEGLLMLGKKNTLLLMVLLSFSLFLTSSTYASTNEKIVDDIKTIDNDNLQRNKANPIDYDSGINLADYTDHAPIYTTSTSDLAAISNSGSGTLASPYIIEGWKITATDTYGIAIFTTNAHFTIRNCWIIMTTIDIGIFIDTGLGFDTIKIENNIIEGGSTAIWALTGGIDMVNNTLIDNRFGIMCSGSSDHIIANNTIINSQNLGVSISYTEQPIIENNTFVGCGLSLGQPDLNSYLGCTIKDNTMNGLPHGYFKSEEDIIITEQYGEILLINCTNVIVTDQSFKNTNTGIKLASCDSTVIKDCSLTDNTQGIDFDLCYNCSVIESEVTYSGTGIWFGRSSYCVLNNCRLTENSYNTIYDSDHCNITWNFFNGNYKQLDMQSSSSNNVFHKNVIISETNDKAYDDGSSNVWYDTETLEGNIWSDYSGTGDYLITGSAGSVDPYPNSFTHPDFNIHVYIEIGSDSGFNSTNGVSSGAGTALDPYIIENWLIIVPTGNGISIHDTTAHFIIRNCYIDAGTSGSYPEYENAILIANTADGTGRIENNILANSNYGIHLRYTNDNLIVNNTCTYNFKGIYLDNSDNNSIFDNELSSNNEVGIRFLYAESNLIVNNTFSNNHYGLNLLYSHYSFVNTNNFSLNAIGIELYETDDCTIIYNWIADSTNYGIFIDFSCDNNIIHHNNIIDNTVQAYDVGNNIWYDEEKLEGNYWSDYSGTGDYSIDGGAVDPYPLGAVVVPEFDHFNLFALVLALIPVAIVRRKK